MKNADVPLDGHEFDEKTDMPLDADGNQCGPDTVIAGCTCGWIGEHHHPIDGPEYARRAERDWAREHYPEAARTAIPKDLAERVRAVEADLDQLTTAHPLAALRLAVEAGGLFGTRAKAAALQASLDYSWAEIGQTIGISKQAAWERFGKHRPETAT